MIARVFRPILLCNLLFSLLLIAFTPTFALADDHGLSNPDQVQKALQQWKSSQAAQFAAQLQNIQHSDGAITADLQLNAPSDKKLRIIITARPHDGNAHGGVLLPSLLLLTDPRSPDAPFQPAMASLLEALKHLDTGQLGEKNRNPGGQPTPFLLPVTWLLLALSLLAVPRVLGQAWRFLREDQPWKRLFCVILLAFALRAFTPHRLVMVYFGYLHFDDAVFSQHLPRYGSATTLLDHAWFNVLELLTGQQPRIEWQLWQHVIMGTLTLLPLAALAQRLFDVRHAGLMTLLLLGILPMSLLDHGSESMLVPAMLWWSCAALALQEYEQSPNFGDLATAVVLLALCGLSRPDAMLVGPLTAILLLKKPQRFWKPLGGLALILVLLWLPGIAFLHERTAEDLAQGNLPHLQLQFLAELPLRLWHGWVVLEPRYFPKIWTAMAVVALLFHGLAAPARRLWLAAALWALPMLLDFNETSMLRLHAPSAMLIVLAASGFTAHVVENWSKWLSLPLLGLMLFEDSTTNTYGAVFAEQNSTTDQTILAEVARHSGDNVAATYVMRGYDDQPDRGVHLFAPQALLQHGDRWLTIGEYLRDPAAVHRNGPVYAVQNLRCYAGLAEQRALYVEARHPACVALCRQAKCKVLLEKSVYNYGERGFDWYPRGGDSREFSWQLLELSLK